MTWHSRWAAARLPTTRPSKPRPPNRPTSSASEDMDHTVTALILLAALAVFLVGGLWIALSLLGLGWLAMVLFTDSPAGKLMATTVWGSSASWALTALPLFIW